MSPEKNPSVPEPVVPTIAPEGKSFPVPSDVNAPGKTIPDKHTSSGAKIPSSYSKG